MTYVSQEHFFSGTDWQQSSGPEVDRKWHEADLWPIADNSIEGTKDALEDGLHPVVAIGGRTTSARPENLTGVVKTYNADATMAVINIADGAVVRAYVSNITTYAGGVPTGWETAPVIGQPVYVDDSAQLGEGCTLSLSDTNSADLANPLAGWLFYCQDEYQDYEVGGPNVASDWVIGSLPAWDDDPGNEYEVCVLLTNDSGQACCAAALQ